MPLVCQSPDALGEPVNVRSYSEWLDWLKWLAVFQRESELPVEGPSASTYQEWPEPL